MSSPEDPVASPPSDGLHCTHKRSRFARRIFCIEVMIGFLLGGLLLGYFMLHHQHRKVVLHIMANPLAHTGAALKGASTVCYSSLAMMHLWRFLTL